MFRNRGEPVSRDGSPLRNRIDPLFRRCLWSGNRTRDPGVHGPVLYPAELATMETTGFEPADLSITGSLRHDHPGRFASLSRYPFVRVRSRNARNRPRITGLVRRRPGGIEINFSSIPPRSSLFNFPRRFEGHTSPVSVDVPRKISQKRKSLPSGHARKARRTRSFDPSGGERKPSGETGARAKHRRARFRAGKLLPDGVFDVVRFHEFFLAPQLAAEKIGLERRIVNGKFTLHLRRGDDRALSVSP